MLGVASLVEKASCLLRLLREVTSENFPDLPEILAISREFTLKYLDFRRNTAFL